RYTAVQSGSAGSLSLWIDSGTTATAVAVGIYRDSSGTPGTLLTHATITAPRLGAWNSVAVPAEHVYAGQRYWLALLGVGGTVRFRDVAAGGGPNQNSARTDLTRLPSGWSGGARYHNAPASFFASVSAGTAPSA